ncbi:hypothetical protein M422DRAFT_274594 [Sphaerobolus stellatus SS14]|uniref:DUF6533 domain-containing protein n=1 Tax=Sphaerobolus stellatus (strain SS14) TaxID=990650 RepID=A0A0C9U648_SPHS4|nr:hypothetical protein M422DRAFT_274594 [Sphaerobolus stellatus SS14]
MSSNSALPQPQVDPLVVQEIYNSQLAQVLNEYAACVALTLVAYDALLTFHHQVELVWGKKGSLGSILYLLTLYATLFYIIVSLIFLFMNGPLWYISHSLMSRGNILGIISFMAVHGLLILRVYAISGGNRPITSFLVLALAARGALAVATIPDSQCTNGGLAVKEVQDLEQNTQLNLAGVDIAENTLAAVIDAASILVTLYYGRNSPGHALLGIPTATDLLFKHGILRFLIIFIWELKLAIGTKLIPSHFVDLDAVLQLCISTILVCRFVLELRGLNNGYDGTSGLEGSRQFSLFKDIGQRIHEDVLNDFALASHLTSATDIIDSIQPGQDQEGDPWSIRTLPQI